MREIFTKTNVEGSEKMDKFNEELSQATNMWIVRIGNYLKSRDDLQHNLEKENKSLEECFRYVLNELANKARKNQQNNVGYVAGDDEEIYELAVHYYDEDDIEVPEKLNFRTNANGTANTSQLTSNKTTKKAKVPKKQLKNVKKEKVSKDQLSIFDL